MKSRNRATGHALLANGAVFELQGLTLALPLSDVVIFAKRYPPELVARYPGLPDHLLYSFKILMDDEILDASAVR